MKLLIIILLLCLPMTAGATTYYVKTAANGGSDAANGTSWETAWATVAKVNATISAGDEIRFGAGKWYDVEFIPPTGGSYALRTVYACSTKTTETQGDCIFYGGEIRTGWEPWGDFVNDTIYAMAWTGEKGWVCLVDDSLMCPVSDHPTYNNFDVSKLNKRGMYLCDTDSQMIYLRCPTNDDPDNHTVITAHHPVVTFPDPGAYRSHIQFWGLDLRGGSGCVVFLGSPTDSVFFEHCNITRGCGADGSNKGGMFSIAMNDADTSSGSIGRFTTVYACSLGHIANEPNDTNNSHWFYGHCMTTYAQNYWTNNRVAFYPPHGLGFYVKSKASRTVAITGHTSKYCTFEGTLQSAFQITASTGYDSCYGSTFIDCNHALSLLGTQGTLYEGNLFVCNNTIYSSSVRGYVMSDNGFNFLGYNNKIKYNINSDMNTGTQEWGFGYDESDSTHTFFDIDSNLYWDCRDNFRTGGCGTGSAFVTNWRGECGFDLNSTLNAVDPAFTDEINHDFSRITFTEWADSIYYGDQWWYTEGQWQPRGGGEPPVGDSLKIRNRNCLGGGLIQ